MRIINVISRTDAYILIRDLNLKPKAAGTIDVDTLILSELKSLRNLSMANDIIISEIDFNYIVNKIVSMSGSSGGGAASYPSFTGNAGKVLTVNATEDGVEWTTVSNGGETPPNEMHFTTLEGSVDYVGTQGDQILLSDNSIVDITVTDETVTFNVPTGKHIVKLVESVDRNNYVSVGGEDLVELHNFPTLSTVTKFNFATGNYNPLPNLTKVPDFFPSNIIDIKGLFFGATNFNQDISMWNVSSVTNMDSMFYNANSFNQPLNNWNVSNVTNMNVMFSYANSFNQDLSNWNVSNVTNVAEMFYGASAFNQPLNNWNVSNVTNMAYMFSYANSFNQDLNNWNVSNVTEMSYMFSGATSFNQDLSQWCVPGEVATNNFATDSSLQVIHFPVWGTCPRGEVPAVTITAPGEPYTVGNTYQLAYNYNQDPGTVTSVEWASNTGAVTVDNTGLMTAVSVGDAFVSVTINGTATNRNYVVVSA